MFKNLIFFSPIGIIFSAGFNRKIYIKMETKNSCQLTRYGRQTKTIFSSEPPRNLPPILLFLASNRRTRIPNWLGRENEENVVRTRYFCGWPSSPQLTTFLFTCKLDVWRKLEIKSLKVTWSSLYWYKCRPQKPNPIESYVIPILVASVTRVTQYTLISLFTCTIWSFGFQTLNRFVSYTQIYLYYTPISICILHPNLFVSCSQIYLYHKHKSFCIMHPIY